MSKASEVKLPQNGQKQQSDKQRLLQAVRNLRKIAGQASLDGTVDQIGQVRQLLEEDTAALMDHLNSLPADYEIDTDG